MVSDLNLTLFRVNGLLANHCCNISMSRRPKITGMFSCRYRYLGHVLGESNSSKLSVGRGEMGMNPSPREVHPEGRVRVEVR